jgi:hypothetical protein
LSRKTNHGSKCKKVYEAEAILKDKGLFVFRRTSPHGLFHIVALQPSGVSLYQVIRLHSFNFSDINDELVKVQDFVMSENYPENSEMELWVWVNNKGWIKYFFTSNGQFHKYEDYGTNDFRKKKKLVEKS